MKLRFLIPAALVAVLCGFFWYALWDDPNDPNRYDPQLIESPIVGHPAPGFSAPSLADPAQRIALKQFLGKPFILNFWGTWCVACRDEHPELLAIQQEAAIPIVGIDWKEENHQNAKEWLSQLGNPYYVVGTDDDGRIAIDWGVYGAPETYLVGADGRVLRKKTGPMSVKIWRDEFVPRLKSNGSAP
jgi:cytochrome c biogenesis protein CcmG/thiol:disulfide interchange protein DsbE